MSSTNYLRLGLIFTVTGIIVLVHYALAGGGRLPAGAELVVGLVLVVVGLPLLALSMRGRPRR